MKRALLATFVALQVLDVVSTHLALAGCATCHEGNPVVAATMAHLGAWWWAPKMALMLALVPLLARLCTGFVAAACTFTTVVIVSNTLSF